MTRRSIHGVPMAASTTTGSLALEIAARWPDRVTSLALLCSAQTGCEPSVELKAFGEREEELIEAGDTSPQPSNSTWTPGWVRSPRHQPGEATPDARPQPDGPGGR